MRYPFETHPLEAVPSGAAFFVSRETMDSAVDRVVEEETVKKGLLLLSIVLLLPSGEAFARHRTHVVIHKHYAVGSTHPVARPIQPIGFVAFVVPPLGMFYDLSRRTNCEGDVLGLGGPGFSSPLTPATGNVMTTAYMRGECPSVGPH